MNATNRPIEVPIERLEVSAYKIPTDFPESDGIFEWTSTTTVIVEPFAGGKSGLGYTYGSSAVGTMVRDLLADKIHGRDAIVIPGIWQFMVAAIHEMTQLFPNGEDAKRLQDQTFLLSEFLEKKAPVYHAPTLKRKAIVQGHCHHTAIMRMDDESSILSKLGLDVQVFDDGCCGMAGAFGFEKGDHFDVSIKAGERALLPAIRQADKETLIVADGFSCREQITQSTDRKGLHLAGVLSIAMRGGAQAPPEDYPERRLFGQDRD